MSLELYSFSDLSAIQQQNTAQYVSDFTNGKLGEQPQMLATTAEDIVNKYVGIVAFKDGKLAGFIGATDPVDHNGSIMSEVGTLSVASEFRKQGIAHAMVQTITNELVNIDALPYAFSNPLSSPIFTAAGYKKANSEEIPSAAISQCLNCRKKPLTGCCDVMLVFEGSKL